jgi:hypothetical protein
MHESLFAVHSWKLARQWLNDITNENATHRVRLYASTTRSVKDVSIAASDPSKDRQQLWVDWKGAAPPALQLSTFSIGLPRPSRLVGERQASLLEVDVGPPERSQFSDAQYGARHVRQAEEDI